LLFAVGWAGLHIWIAEKGKNHRSRILQTFASKAKEKRVFEKVCLLVEWAPLLREPLSQPTSVQIFSAAPPSS